MYPRHPPQSSVYEATNNPLTEVSVMVFYRGLEHLIKAFYSPCLILNRSLNCGATKCQCSLNISMLSSKRKTAETAQKWGNPRLWFPAASTGKGWESGLFLY